MEVPTDVGKEAEQVPTLEAPPDEGEDLPVGKPEVFEYPTLPS